MKKFVTGKAYYARFSGDYDSILRIEIVSRTEKTARIKYGNKIRRVKIHNQEAEHLYPLGRYSLCPVVWSSKLLLTRESAKTALTVMNLDHPEWGPRAFHYNTQLLGNGQYASTVTPERCDYPVTVLNDNEFESWEVITEKEVSA
jgi:hypothetical protein